MSSMTSSMHITYYFEILLKLFLGTTPHLSILIEPLLKLYVTLSTAETQFAKGQIAFLLWKE